MIITGKYPKLRLRRSRQENWSRRLIEESNLSANDLILPIFITEGNNKKQKIKNMQNIYRYSLDKLPKIIDRAIKLKIPMVALFPFIEKKLKDNYGSEAINENNLVC